MVGAPREPVVSLVPIAPDMPASEAGGGASSPSRAIFFTTMRARATRMPCPRSRVPDVAPPSVVVVPPSVVTEPPALTSTESLPLPVHPTPTRNIAAMATLSFLAFMTPLLSALILLEPLSPYRAPPLPIPYPLATRWVPFETFVQGSQRTRRPLFGPINS